MEEFEFLLRVSEFISLFQDWFNGEVMNKFVSFWMLKLLKHVCKVGGGCSSWASILFSHSYTERERERLRGRGISHGGKCGVTDFQMECLS